MGNRPLPPRENWHGDEGWEPLYYLEGALDEGVIAALTIGRAASGYQVSVRRDTDGWEVFYGTDIADTIARAVMAGPQSPPPAKEPPGAPLAIVGTLTNAWPNGGPRHDNGVEYAFNSEGIEPL